MSLIEPEFSGWWNYWARIDDSDISPALKLLLRLMCEKAWDAAVEKMQTLNT